MNRKLLFWSIATWCVSVCCIFILGASSPSVSCESPSNDVEYSYNVDFVQLKDYDISILIPKEEPEPISYEPVVEEKSPYYNVTAYERELLERLVYHEGNTESIECQMAIVSVVFNRLDDEYGRYGDTIEEVIFAPGQFTVASYIFEKEPTETNKEAVDWVIWNGPSIEPEVQYFRSGYYFSWVDPAFNIDNTYFSYGNF